MRTLSTLGQSAYGIGRLGGKAPGRHRNLSSARALSSGPRARAALSKQPGRSRASAAVCRPVGAAVYSETRGPLTKLGHRLWYGGGGGRVHPTVGVPPWGGDLPTRRHSTVHIEAVGFRRLWL